MFDINGSHIALLNDSDLRTLVARLCEAELRRADLPLSAVTAGGDQNAADGGLDVRVDLPLVTNINGFIPRPVTGFQVKVPDMPRAEILKEMRPKGKLRPVIKNLVSVPGAYIIVSAKGSTSDIVLQNRRKAMRDALGKTHGADSLALDFYDRERVASWVRDHPGIVTWVRERIGQAIPGWQPYKNWANSKESEDAEYIIDEKLRLRDWRSPQEELSVTAGIQKIREILGHDQGVVRLVGLSGTGKTRLVQALFDKRVGLYVLDPTLAIYTDFTDQPDPFPSDLMRHLIQLGRRAIIIVDNCPPDTHRSLAKICAEKKCPLSLITVEYDVGDDDPEGTEVFRLEPASNGVIDKILQHQAPQISTVDRERISNFSGGNARMALALAHTVRRGQSVSDLSDEELFNRLFHQRRTRDDSLLRAAEIFSLVYSFEGESLEGQSDELPFLARLAEMPVNQLYRHVSELFKRTLVQRRSKWRAVLPHALANRLARNCLEKIPPEVVSNHFLKNGTERLLRSFSRRLGYLHDCEAAQKIVQAWLAPGGLLADISRLDELGIAMFRNVTPVAPEAALLAIEKCLNGDNGKLIIDISNHDRRTWVDLLRSIAYDPVLFERAASLLVRFVMVEPENFNYNPSRDHFYALFQIVLSGTHASIQQRLKIINSLIETSDDVSQAIGVHALDSLLKTDHFNSSYNFEFGARPRNYGWQPESGDDVTEWYHAALVYIKPLALSNDCLGKMVSSTLAKNFRGLWTHVAVVHELESLAIAIAEQGFWLEGWIAVRNTIRRDIKDMPPDHINKIRGLEVILQPKDLLQTTRAYIFSSYGSALDIVDGELGVDKDEGAKNNRESAYDRVEEMVAECGREVAIHTDIFDQLLPDLVRREVQRGWQFGRGLATGADQLLKVWERLVDALAKTPTHERDIQVLRGFLHATAERNAEIAGKILDDAIENPVLGAWFPVLQATVTIDSRGVERLETSLKIGLASAWAYRQLSIGCATDPIAISLFHRLILKIASKADGYLVAVEIFGRRLHSEIRSGKSIDNELIQCGQDLLKSCPFERSSDSLDYYLEEIINVCLIGDYAESAAIHVCRQYKKALSNHPYYRNNYDNLLAGLFRTQPYVALDEFLAESNDEGIMALGDMAFDRWNPLDAAPMESLISWAEVNPSARFPLLASVITYFKKGDNKDLEWSPIALQILNRSPDKVSILDKFGSRFYPHGGWRGSLKEILESRRALIRALVTHSDPLVVAWSKKMNLKLDEMIMNARTDLPTDVGFE